MDSYCDVNNAYSNKGILNDNCEPVDLEKLARQVNNSKKSRSKDIYRQYRKGSEGLDRSAQAFNTMISSRADKGILGADMSISQIATSSNNSSINPILRGIKKPVNGFYSAQGDYAEFKAMGDNDVNINYEPKNMSQTLICDIANNDAKAKHRKKLVMDDGSGSDGISLDTPSDGDSNSSFSSMTWDTKEIDKHIKTKSKFNDKKRSKRHKCMDFDIDSVDSLESLDSGESLLRHIRFCKECKDKVMGLIRKHKTDSIKLVKNDKKSSKCAHILNSVEDSLPDNTEKISQDNQQSIRFPEIKEIVTVCLIGFLVIIILDLMMRNK